MLGIILAIAYIALLLYLMRRMPFFAHVAGLPLRTIVLFFLLKVVAGTALWAVYTWAYPDRSMADIFKYFDDSKVMYDALWSEPIDFLRMLTGIGNDSPHFTEKYYLAMNNWVRRFETNVYNDSHTMIRFNAVLRLLSFGHYHVHTVFASFLSTAGLVAMFRAFVPMVNGLQRGLVLVVFAWPSALFWASGPLKESLLLLGMGFFLLGAIGPLDRSRMMRTVLAFLAGLAVMLVVKFYVLLCLIPGLLGWWWVRQRPRQAVLKFIAVHAVLVALALGIGQLFPERDILYMLAMKQSDFLGMAQEVQSGSVLNVPLLEPTIPSFVRHMPIAIHLAMISPFEVASKGPLPFAAALENVLVLGLPLLALAYRRRWAAAEHAGVLLALSFILLLTLLIGWTVPVVGAIVRYRVPMLPFIGLLSLLLIDHTRAPQWLKSIIRP